MRSCAAIWSGTPSSTPSTAAVTSSRTNSFERSGWWHSGFRCISSARSTGRPHCRALARPPPPRAPRREQVLQGLGGDQLGGLGFVHPPPQLLVTLQPRQEAGLRELGGCARVGGHRGETNGLGDVRASATSARAKYISCA